MPCPPVALAAQPLLPAPRSDLGDVHSFTAAHRIVRGYDGAIPSSAPPQALTRCRASNTRGYLAAFKPLTSNR